jgi:hypothetical protein
MWNARRFLDTKPTKLCRVRQCMNLYRRQDNIFSGYDTSLRTDTPVVEVDHMRWQYARFFHTDRLCYFITNYNRVNLHLPSQTSC